MHIWATGPPPLNITESDVERVYRKQDVRKHISERFGWTLALDTRYQAVAWSLIEDQMSQSGGYETSYAPSDVLAMVQQWWPAGFDKTDSDQLRGLLDELVGLGVLVRSENGRSRLRVPNLVRLTGCGRHRGSA